MNIFNLITLLGGLAFFLFGMKTMSDGLEKTASSKLNSSLSKVTDNRFMAMLCGAGMTIAVQSSSAVTVMLVGLVNSGILEFQQTIGVLMGSNIGTTLTAWLLSLAGIDSDIFWLNLLKPVNFSPVFAFVGIIMIMVSKKEKVQSLGGVFVGFAVLMFGMNLMSDSMKPLAEMPEFASILTAFNNPLLAVLAGAIFTGIIQSSAASVAILQALSMTGGVTYGMAIPIIMGQNIGTCVTAVLSSIGVNRNAKKVAVVHLAFNIIGTLLCLIPFCIGNAILDWTFTEKNISPFMIAIVHSIFNVVTTLFLLPFINQLASLANRLIPDMEKSNPPETMLDERLLTVPTMAVQQCSEAVIEMCTLSQHAFLEAMKLISSFQKERVQEISRIESTLDEYEDHISTYMMKLSLIGVSNKDSKSIAKMLHTMDDFERIGDHASNLASTALDLQERKLTFSPSACNELTKLTEALTEILNITANAFIHNDITLAKSVEPLEEVIDDLILEIRRNHISRLQNGECTISMGFVLNDILTCYSRTSDHCSNIAIAIIESQRGTFDAHEYIEVLRSQNHEEFDAMYQSYANQFTLK